MTASLRVTVTSLRASPLRWLLIAVHVLMLSGRAAALERLGRLAVRTELPEELRQAKGSLSGPPKDLLVIVRTFRPLAGMIQRMRDFDNDLRAHMPSAQLVISIDSHGMSDYKGWMRRPLIKAAAKHALFHIYNWDDISKQFPVLRDVPNTGAWNFHMEPTIAAVDFAKQSVPVSKSAMVWVIEDDTFVCNGQVSDFLKHYEHTKKDFLSSPYAPIETNWKWQSNASSDFMQEFSLEKRYRGQEHVQRYSMPFLEHMRKTSLKHYTAWSEMYAPTICMNHGYDCGFFNSEDMGVYIIMGDFINRAKADEICKDAKGVTINHKGNFIAMPQPEDLWSQRLLARYSNTRDSLSAGD